MKTSQGLKPLRYNTAITETRKLILLMHYLNNKTCRPGASAPGNIQAWNLIMTKKFLDYEDLAGAKAPALQYCNNRNQETNIINALPKQQNL
jgi:hypothetical protein